ncbi:MAG: hypothetical protein R3F55_08670 [Alphaproteobacteria bacterium]
MDLAVGSTSTLQSLQDPTGAVPNQPRTAPSAAENAAASSQRGAERTEAAAASRAEAAPAEKTEAAPPKPPAESGRGQLVDIAA